MFYGVKVKEWPAASSHEPAASTCPVTAMPLSVLDLGSLVHVPVVTGDACDLDVVVTVEALAV